MPTPHFQYSSIHITDYGYFSANCHTTSLCSQPITFQRAFMFWPGFQKTPLQCASVSFSCPYALENAAHVHTHAHSALVILKVEIQHNAPMLVSVNISSLRNTIAITTSQEELMLAELLQFVSASTWISFKHDSHATTQTAVFFL